ncbi:MAG: UDP-glucose 4 epimerase [Bacteroidetes bacterium]|nr:UDP-glucose 4 epimerase [Bacteroidota bacterium]
MYRFPVCKKNFYLCCMAKKVLITGASGFIGSFLVEKALASGYETYAGVRAGSSLEYLQDERIRFVNLYYSDQKQLTTQLRNMTVSEGKFDYIVHNAGVTKSVNRNAFERVNFQFTANLIDALIDADAVPEKFVLMSSLSVMGPGDELHYSAIQHHDVPQPNTAYGRSKLHAEEYLRAQTNFPYVILRSSGVYGPREKDYLMMIKTMKLGLDISAGMRQQRLTFVYVRDLAEAVFIALQCPVTGKSYFVTDGNEYTDREYTALLRELLGKKLVLRLTIPLSVIKLISIATEEVSKITKQASTLNRDKFRIMKQRNWLCDVEPLHNELGFHAAYDLRKGLEESIRWYREHHWI